MPVNTLVGLFADPDCVAGKREIPQPLIRSQAITSVEKNNVLEDDLPARY
jgi:hypothetical protein